MNKVMITVEINKELRDEFNHYAKVNDMNFNEMIEKGLRYGLCEVIRLNIERLENDLVHK